MSPFLQGNCASTTPLPRRAKNGGASFTASAAPASWQGLARGEGRQHLADRLDPIFRCPAISVHINSGRHQYNATLNAFVGNSIGTVGAPWVVDGIAGASSVGASTAQPTQAMASFGTTAASSSAPLPILAAPEQSQQTLLTTLPHA